jgi:hypothetical protein
MSCAVVIQKESDIFLGSDSALSVTIGDDLYRLNEDGQKLFIIDDKVIFCSGKCLVSDLIINTFSQSKNRTIEIYRDIAQSICNKYKDDDYFEKYTMGNFIGVMEDEKAVLYQIDPKENFKIIKNIAVGDQIGLYTGGIKAEEAFESAHNYIKNKYKLSEVYQNTFNDISFEGIGGQLSVLRLNQQGISLFYQNQIKEKNSIKRYTLNNVLACAHSVVAEAVYGQLICGERLIIDASDSNGTKFFQVTSNGVIIDGEALTITNFESSPIGQQVVLVNTAYNDVTISSENGIVCTYEIPSGTTATSNAQVIMNGQDGFQLQTSTTNGQSWTTVFSVPTITSGGIVAGSVQCQGLYAQNAYIQGTGWFSDLFIGSQEINALIDGQINGQAIAASTVSDTQIANVSAAKITAGIIVDTISITAPIINGGVITGTTIKGSVIESINGGGQLNGMCVIGEDLGSVYYYQNGTQTAAMLNNGSAGFELMPFNGYALSIGNPDGSPVKFVGNVSFSGATVTGLTSVAVFG